MSKHIFGPAINAFTIIAGSVLNGEMDNQTIAILDGDVYTTEDEKMERINAVLTGQAFDNQREQAKNAILQYRLPENQKPEMFIRNAILSLTNEILPEENEIRIVLNEIGVVDDDHRYLDDAIMRLDLEYAVGLAKLISCFAKSSYWDAYISPIRSWLEPLLRTL